jgi:hypothetical protein
MDSACTQTVREAFERIFERHGLPEAIRAGVMLRRAVPVPGILATHRPGTIMDKSRLQFVARYQFADDRTKTVTVLPLS